MTRPGRSRLLLLAAAALFSTGGTAIKAASLSGWQVAAGRSAVAGLALVLFLPGARGRWTWRTVVVGAAFAVTMLTFVIANKLTTAANAIFLQATAPLYIAVIAPLALGEPIRRRDLLYMGAMAVGLGAFFVGQAAPLRTAPNPAAGNLVGALSGLTWALTVMGLRLLGRGAGQSATLPAVVAGSALTVGAAAPFALPFDRVAPEDGLILLFLGIVQIGLAYVCLTKGVTGVPALEASLLLLLEPVLSPIWAWMVHGEPVGGWSLVGGAVLLGATAVNQVATATSLSSAPTRPASTR